MSGMGKGLSKGKIMNKKFISVRKNFRLIFLFSPAGFLVRGIGICILFFILHAMGFNKYLGIVFGTFYIGNLNIFSFFWKILAILYSLSYFAFILLAPILIIGSGIFWILKRLIKVN